jgi:thymidylate kinase
MQRMSRLDRSASATFADDAHHSSGPGRILLGVFETLDRAAIPYCVLHGYESYPQRVRSDVDCMISANVLPDRLAALFHENRTTRIGADMVYCRGYYFVFAGNNADRSPCFLVLDLSVDYEIGGLKFYSGREVIESRHRHDQFWVSAADLEFGGYLIRKIGKRELSDEQGRRLSALYAQDPSGCQQQIARFWGAKNSALIASAASSGDWGRVRHFLPELRAEMRMRARCRHPWYAIGSWARRVGRRVRSACWPDGGLTVVFLGPDGAGKSSVIKAVPQALAGAFNRTTCYGFAPGILGWLRPPDGPNTQPHAAPPRSPMSSVMRALCYWFVYYLVCYRTTLRLHLAHSTLVLHDRHLVDALVDPKRYRYSGPMWLLRLIWWFVPRPDLIILLDAPPEVLQARKQEVSFEESARQREAYRSLVGRMANGHIVDAAQPLQRVVADVTDIILQCLATRTANRLGLDRTASYRRTPALFEAQHSRRSRRNAPTRKQQSKRSDATISN